MTSSGPVPDGSPHFLVGRLPPAGPFTVDGNEGRHAAVVRRMRVGERLVLTDGKGGWAPASIVGVGKAELHLAVAESRWAEPVAPRVILVQALPKGERSELAVELATEAGVDEIVPWAAARCVAKWPDPAKVERGVSKWQAAARESAKQARRVFVPRVQPLAGTAAVCRLIEEASTTIVLHEAASDPLTGVILPLDGDLLVVVGPEGGVTPEEIAAFRAAGAHPVRLGREVLRTSTAAAVALGALGVLTDRWK